VYEPQLSCLHLLHLEAHGSESISVLDNAEPNSASLLESLLDFVDALNRYAFGSVSLDRVKK